MSTSATPAMQTPEDSPPRPDKEKNWAQLRQSCEHWRQRAQKAEARLAEIEKRNVSDEQVAAAYRRGRSDLQAEIVFAERLAEIRKKYPDFDYAWGAVRPLVPRTVWTEAAELEHGLEGLYQLSQLPDLCKELSELEPGKAAERFKFFVRDLAVLKGAR